MILNNNLVYLSLICFTIFTVNAMDKPLPKKSPITAKTKEFVDIDTHPIIKLTGKVIRFYGEYKARAFPNDIASFPLEAIDPLPILNFGSIRYFFTSATEGNAPTYGEPIKIEDPSITNIFAVRGKDDANGNRFEAYYGFNKNNFKMKNKNKIYTGQLLSLKLKSTQDTSSMNISISGMVNYLRTTEMVQEAQKYIEDPKDMNWNNEKFWQLLLKMLGGSGWKQMLDYSYSPPQIYYKKEGMIIKNNAFYSDVVYWNQYRNLLKGTGYRINP